MKAKIFRFTTALSLLVAFVVPFQLAQETQDHQQTHHHYKLIDMGTFGGPQSYFVYPDFTSEANVNNEGVAAGWADTPFPDPYPNFCFWDCYIDHAFCFQWKNGARTDLGVLPGGASSQPSWVSASGLISGWSQNGEIDPLVTGFPENRAVLWTDGHIRDLGVLPEGGYESLGFAVNGSGLVVGLATNTVPDQYSMFGFGYQARAFVWDEQDGMQDLGTLGGTDAQALLVNERGQVTGYSYTSSAPSAACASQGLGLSLTTGTFFWDKESGMADIGGLGGTCTNVLGFNNRGQIVGLSFLTGDQIIHAFLWDRTMGLKDLGTLGGNFANAYAINDSGDVVGGSDLPNGQPDATLWRKGGITDLGGLPGGCGSFGFWINASDQVVGNAFNDCTFETTTGFLWEHGAPMADLNALLVPGSGFFVPAGNTINDRGEISATAVSADQHEHAVLLIPCDENHPGVEGCDYSLVDAAAATGESPAPLMHEPTTPNPRRLRPFGRRGLTFTTRQIRANSSALPDLD